MKMLSLYSASPSPVQESSTSTRKKIVAAIAILTACGNSDCGWELTWPCVCHQATPETAALGDVDRSSEPRGSCPAQLIKNRCLRDVGTQGPDSTHFQIEIAIKKHKQMG
jgi:hypothetical protein